MKNILSLLMVSIFSATSAFGLQNSETYVMFEQAYKNMTKPDRTIDTRKVERSFNQDPELKKNFAAVLSALKSTKNAPKIALLFFQKDGMKYPRLQIGDQKESIFIDIHGDEDRFMRLGNAYYSMAEVRDPEVFLAKLMKNDPRLEREYRQSLINEKIVITQKIWNALNPTQRILLIAGIRNLLIDAENVQEKFGKKSRKTSWLDAMLSEAQADGEGEVGGNLPGCVVAGYKSKYVDGKCSVAEARKDSNYKACSSNPSLSSLMSCNPVIFGFQAGKQPHCLPTNDLSRFKTATLICHKELSPLDGPDDSRKLVQSILTSQDKTVADYFIDGKIRSDKFDELKESILDPFTIAIDGAIALCNLPGQLDSEQASACRSLGERKTNFERDFRLMKAEGAQGAAEQAVRCRPVPQGTPSGVGQAGSLPPPTPVPGAGGDALPWCGEPPGGFAGPTTPPGATTLTPGAGTTPAHLLPTPPGSFQNASSSSGGFKQFWRDWKGPIIGTLVTAASFGTLYYVLKKPKGKTTKKVAVDPVAPPTTTPVAPPGETAQPILPATR